MVSTLPNHWRRRLTSLCLQVPALKFKLVSVFVEPLGLRTVNKVLTSGQVNIKFHHYHLAYKCQSLNLPLIVLA